MVTPRKARQYRFQTLLAALLLLMLLFPVFAQYVEAPRAISVVFTVLLVSGVAAAGETRRRLLTAVVIGAPMLVASWAAGFSDAIVLRLVSQAGAVVFYVFLLRIVLRAVFSQETVESDTLYGAACGYLLIGMAWTSLYAVAVIVDPQALTGSGLEISGGRSTWPDLMYFSFVTLTTLGFGDIVPSSTVARSLATTEAAAGVLYVAIVVARLVGLYRADDPGPKHP